MSTAALDCYNNGVESFNLARNAYENGNWQLAHSRAKDAIIDLNIWRVYMTDLGETTPSTDEYMWMAQHIIDTAQPKLELPVDALMQEMQHHFQGMQM